MAERTVKSLQRTGRVSRAKARSVAIELMSKLKSADLPSGADIVRKSTTASGKKKIAFVWVKPNKKTSSARSKAARKRA